MRERTDCARVRERARGRWDAVLAALAPELAAALARPGRHVPCPHPAHPGSRDGFRLFRDLEERGGGICNTCGAFPDGFALLMWLRGWRFDEALGQVAATLGERPVARATAPPPAHLRLPVPMPDRGGSGLTPAARAVWEAGIDPQDPRAAPLQRYLDRRGIDVEVADPEAVRYHPALGYWADGRCIATAPAMIALLRDPAGRALTVHRTYLDPAGRKAALGVPRKLMPGAASGGLPGAAVRLCPVRSATLGLAEGIETALAVHCATAMPVWAATSATLLAALVLPAALREVHIWADRDRSGTGERAARALERRLRAEGRAVRVHLPVGRIPAGASGIDWNDAWVEAGGAAFPGGMDASAA